jgi:hypothetical protein
MTDRIELHQRISVEGADEDPLGVDSGENMAVPAREA